MSLAEMVKQKIEAALVGSSVEVTDFTQEHLNHGASGAHLEVVVTFLGFKDLSLVEQHKRIYTILDEEFKNKTIHALRIKTQNG